MSLIMPLRDKEKRRRLRFQAQGLAKTGRYRNWEEIAAALKREGREGNGKALNAPLTRLTLDIRCALARPRPDIV